MVAFIWHPVNLKSLLNRLWENLYAHISSKCLPMLQKKFQQQSNYVVTTTKTKPHSAVYLIRSLLQKLNYYLENRKKKKIYYFCYTRNFNFNG